MARPSNDTRICWDDAKTAVCTALERRHVQRSGPYHLAVITYYYWCQLVGVKQISIGQAASACQKMLAVLAPAKAYGCVIGHA